jgi:hypothetical protein
VMSSFYRRFALKCLADPKVNFSALQTIWWACKDTIENDKIRIFYKTSFYM